MVHLHFFVIIHSPMDGIASKVTLGRKCLRHALLLTNVVPTPLAGLTVLIRQQKKAKSPKRSASAGAQTAARGRSILKYSTAEVSSCITSTERPRNIHVIFVIVVLTEGFDAPIHPKFINRAFPWPASVRASALFSFKGLCCLIKFLYPWPKTVCYYFTLGDL